MVRCGVTRNCGEWKFTKKFHLDHLPAEFQYLLGNKQVITFNTQLYQVALQVSKGEIFPEQVAELAILLQLHSCCHAL